MVTLGKGTVWTALIVLIVPLLWLYSNMAGTDLQTDVTSATGGGPPQRTKLQTKRPEGTFRHVSPHHKAEDDIFNTEDIHEGEEEGSGGGGGSVRDVDAFEDVVPHRLTMGVTASIPDPSQSNFPPSGQVDIYRDGMFTVWKNSQWVNITLPPLPDVSFLPEYTNPCWDKAGWERTSGGGATFHCVPYFYVIGQPKCGSSDLWNKLIQHPSIVPTGRKGTQWWSRRRFGIGKRGTIASFASYVRTFDGAASVIKKQHGDNHGASGSSELITGEATVSMLLPESRVRGRHSNTSRKIVPLTLHHFQPDAKIVAILRNPTTRLFSSLAYFMDVSDPNEVHEYVAKHVSLMEECLSNHGLWHCAYERGLSSGRLRTGLYYPYLYDWMQVFPKSQVKVVRMEDYAVDRVPVLNEIFKFLGLDVLPSKVADVVGTEKVGNKGPPRPEMFNKTRKMLGDFYQPFNEMLADLLQDQNYLWKD